MTLNKAHLSDEILQKMTANNPMLGLVSVDVHTNFGQILTIYSQDIKWKPFIHGITERRNLGMTEVQGESSIDPLFQSMAITSFTVA